MCIYIGRNDDDDVFRGRERITDDFNIYRAIRINELEMLYGVIVGITDGKFRILLGNKCV